MEAILIQKGRTVWASTLTAILVADEQARTKCKAVADHIYDHDRS